MAIKYIPPRALGQTADYQFQRYKVDIPSGMTLEDLFAPVAWAHVKQHLAQHDIIRCIAEDGSFDVDLTVRKIDVGGAHMIPRPHIGGVSGPEAMRQLSEIAELNTTKTVPIDYQGRPVVRCEYLPATKWRVLGLLGQEVSRGHKTEAEARIEMNKYLAASGLEMPGIKALEEPPPPAPAPVAVDPAPVEDKSVRKAAKKKEVA